jgi:hypothetical protein
VEPSPRATHSMLVAAWHMLRTGELYNDPAATTTRDATPNEPPATSSPNSSDSDTPSPSSRRSQPERVSLQKIGHSPKRRSRVLAATLLAIGSKR